MELNKKLLLDIFHIPAKSRSEKRMGNFVKEYLSYIDVPFEVDSKGNIYSFNGPKPFLSAHLDTVQDYCDENLSNFIRIVEGKIVVGLGVIGGDDKCGIYTILHILTELENKTDINFAFTVEEEIGTVGAEFLAKHKSKDLRECLYGIIIDRRGNSDIICVDNHYGTKEFEEELHRVGKEFGYSPERGVLSDANVYCKFMSCANISSGYYGAHTKREFVIISHLNNAINFTRKIIEEIKTSFKIPEPAYSNYGGYSGSYGYYDKDKSAWVDIDEEELDEFYEGFYYGRPAIGSGKGRSKTKYKPLKTDFCEICFCASRLQWVPILQNFYCPECLEAIMEDVEDAQTEIEREILLEEKVYW